MVSISLGLLFMSVPFGDSSGDVNFFLLFFALVLYKAILCICKQLRMGYGCETLLYLNTLHGTLLVERGIV